MNQRRTHWDTIYATRSPDDVSWYQPSLKQSLALIREAGIDRSAPVIDVGGGASTLVDDLLGLGYADLTVLDISGEALNRTRARLGRRADSVTWLVADVTTCTLLPAHFALWHDRAVFHFLVAETGRVRYRARLREAVRPGGLAIIATFGPNGPQQCSGLDIIRYTPDTLHAAIGDSFALVTRTVEQHATPFETTQEFIYCVFRRK